MLPQIPENPCKNNTPLVSNNFHFANNLGRNWKHSVVDIAAQAPIIIEGKGNEYISAQFAIITPPDNVANKICSPRNLP